MTNRISPGVQLRIQLKRDRVRYQDRGAVDKRSCSSRTYSARFIVHGEEWGLDRWHRVWDHQLGLCNRRLIMCSRWLRYRPRRGTDGRRARASCGVGYWHFVFDGRRLLVHVTVEWANQHGKLHEIRKVFRYRRTRPQNAPGDVFTRLNPVPGRHGHDHLGAS